MCELRECEPIRMQEVSGLLHRARCILERLQLYKRAPAQALRGCTATQSEEALAPLCCVHQLGLAPTGMDTF